MLSKRQLPNIDKIPDELNYLLMINYTQTAHETIFIFRRPLNVQQHAKFILTPETDATIIWAMSDRIELDYHGAYRGITTVKLSKNLVCDISCKTCFGPEENQCMSCFEGYFLEKGNYETIYLLK